MKMMRRGRHLAAGIVAMFTIAAVFAKSPPVGGAISRRLTLEEQLAQRFDPVSVEERNLAYEAKTPSQKHLQEISTAARAGDDTKHPVAYVVDGHRNPELFLRHELFDMLLSGLTPDESLRVKQRAYYQSSLRSLGYEDATFWSTLESVSGKYLLIRFGDSLPAHRSAGVMREAADSRCRARFDALQEARRLFGEDAFDRVLYTVVAPTAFRSSTTFDPDPKQELRRAEQGCR